MVDSQADLFSRAAACDRLMKVTSNPMRKEILRQIRDVWIRLANESPSMSAQTIDAEIAKVEQIEARFEETE